MANLIGSGSTVTAYVEIQRLRFRLPKLTEIKSTCSTATLP